MSEDLLKPFPYANMLISSYDPEKDPPYTYFPMNPDDDLTEMDGVKLSNVNIVALQTLAQVIALEERRMQRMSGLRVFCRLDLSIYRHTESGKHEYFVNEITRTHGAALFPGWDSNNRLNFMFTHMSNILHFLSFKQLYRQAPIPPFTR